MLRLLRRRAGQLVLSIGLSDRTEISCPLAQPASSTPGSLSPLTPPGVLWSGVPIVDVVIAVSPLGPQGLLWSGVPVLDVCIPVSPLEPQGALWSGMPVGDNSVALPRRLRFSPPSNVSCKARVSEYQACFCALTEQAGLLSLHFISNPCLPYCIPCLSLPPHPSPFLAST